MPIPDGLISARQLCTDAVDTRVIAPNAVTTTEIAAGFNFVELVTTLPISGNFEGRIVYLTTDDKLYRHDGSAFLLAVDGADITAATISGDKMIANTITAGEIQAGAIGASELAAVNIAVGKFIRSTTFVSGSSGWSIDANGTAEFDDVTVRGTIQASSIEGNVTLGTGGVVRTAPSGQRVEIAEAAKDKISFFTGDSFEAVDGLIRGAVVGSGATRTLQTNIRAPVTTGDTGGVQLVIRSESFNDSTSPPGVTFAYAGGSAQTPQLLLQNNFDLRISTGGVIQLSDLGSAANPSLGIGTNFDDGIYSPADNELAVVTAGVLRARFTNTQFRVQNGSAALPSLSFDIDPNTGMYRLSTDAIAWATGGVRRMSLDSSGIFMSVSGSASNPSVRINDADSGLYLAGGDEIGLAAGGEEMFTGRELTAAANEARILPAFSNAIADTDDHVGVTSTGLLRRQTSSLSKKKFVSKVDPAELASIELAPVRYKIKGSRTSRPADLDDSWHLGLIADWLIDQDERLGRRDEKGEPENFRDRAVLAVLGAKDIVTAGRLGSIEARLVALEAA